MNLETWKQLVLEDQGRARKVQMRALIPPNKVGFIMGLKGAKQKTLCSKPTHQMKVTCPPGGSQVPGPYNFVSRMDGNMRHVAKRQSLDYAFLHSRSAAAAYVFFRGDSG